MRELKRYNFSTFTRGAYEAPEGLYMKVADVAEAMDEMREAINKAKNEAPEMTGIALREKDVLTLKQAKRIEELETIEGRAPALLKQNRHLKDKLRRASARVDELRKNLKEVW